MTMPWSQIGSACIGLLVVGFGLALGVMGGCFVGIFVFPIGGFLAGRLVPKGVPFASVAALVPLVAIFPYGPGPTAKSMTDAFATFAFFSMFVCEFLGGVSRRRGPGGPVGGGGAGSAISGVGTVDAARERAPEPPPA